ncbi:unnamed protein product [Sphenostylis stenocarpa]|uniref:Uncharacterized protein n=1 Tax=Sphenostylis stenocarpa TaxID=92480 RepID=A0AA86SL17_9FABA|nr:unnamed protein product [Sphenostylis stenocarpa]
MTPKPESGSGMAGGGEARLEAELEEKKREIGFLRERIAFERLGRINADLELKKLRQKKLVKLVYWTSFPKLLLTSVLLSTNILSVGLTSLSLTPAGGNLGIEDERNPQATLDRKESTSCTIIDNGHQSSPAAFQKNLLTGSNERIGNLKRKFVSSNINILEGLDSEASSDSSSSSLSSGSFDMDSLPVTNNRETRADATSLRLNLSKR